jgi:hypothetical protein
MKTSFYAWSLLITDCRSPLVVRFARHFGRPLA